MRHYYALTDTFTGDDPKYYGAGFSNTKEALAFLTKKERDTWLVTTRLLRVKALTRREALACTAWRAADHMPLPAKEKGVTAVKAVRLYGQPDTYVILARQLY